MDNITVLTTTYNRENYLHKLYCSLCDQTDRKFEWLIVDDGSTDNTDIFINSIIDKADFLIRYYKKENGGKHTALNYAYQFIRTPLTFIVDSDDFLTKDSISSIEKVYKKYGDEKDLCGFSFLRGKSDGGYLSSSGVPKNGMKESYVECRINRNISGDMAEIWYTHCLKEYPFPEFEGEKFLGEDTVWIRMAEKYKMRFFNHVIYISDYLEEGLTNNRRIHNINSPNGCEARAEAFLKSNANMKAKIKAALQYQIYGRFAGKEMQKLFMDSSSKILYLICFVPALALYLKWKRDFSV